MRTRLTYRAEDMPKAARSKTETLADDKFHK